MKKGEASYAMPYPTDSSGLPIHPYELGFMPDWDAKEKTNNHHHAFYARAFGATAVGRAFRDLESLQSRLEIGEHVTLHQRYTGIVPPPPNVMLDRIEEDAENDGVFQVWNFETKQYDLLPITQDGLTELEGTWHGNRVV